MKQFEPGESEPRTSDLPRYTILLVEDSEVDRAICRRLLLHRPMPGSIFQQNPCQLIEVTTGEEALEYCEQHMPDVVLLDYVLPGISGLEVLHALRQQQGQEQLPVIMMTAQSTIEIAVEALKSGALDYLDKSKISAEGLHRAVTSAIQQMQLTQALHKQQQRQQLLTQTALQIRQSLTLKDILQTTVNEVRSILSGDRVMIYQFQPDWSGDVVVESVGEGWTPILGEMIHDPCIINGWAEGYRQGKTTHHNNIATAGLTPCYVELMQRFQVQANLVVPILQDQHLWGLLIAHECKSPRQWEAIDIEFLVQLATQVSIAIQQAALVERLQGELQERQKAEVALETSQTQLQAILDHTTAVVYAKNQQGQYLLVNREYERLTGINRADVVGKTDHVLFPKENAQAFWENDRQVLQTLKPVCFEEAVPLPGGSRTYVALKFPLYNAVNKAYAVCGISTDISDRKQAELELEKFQFLVENASDMVVLFNAEGQFHYANQAFCKAVEYTREELLTMQACGIYVDGSPTAFQSLWQTAQHRQLTREIQHRTQSGQIFDAEVSITYFTFADKEYLGVFARDITERKRIERSLKDSEARLHLAQVSSKSALWDWHISENTLFWSPEYYQLYQLDPSVKPTFENWMQCVHPDDVEQVTQATLLPLTNGSSEVRIEFRVIQADRIRWFAGIGQIFRNDAGEATRMLGITIDITQQKQTELELQYLNQALEHRVAERTEELVKSNDRLQQELFERERAERALQTSEARFRSAFEDAAIGMALVAPDGSFLRGNPALCRFLGYSQAELREMTWQAVTYFDDLDVDLNYVNQMLGNEIQTYQLEKRYFHKNGHVVWGLLGVSLVRDEQGEPLYFISQVQDISDRKRIEDEREQAETALNKELLNNKAFLGASFDGIVTLNNEGYVVEANESFAQMLGYSLEETLALHVSDWDAQWTKDELIKIVKNLMLTDTIFETIHRRKDGSLYEVEISATKVEIEDETVQLCICRDIQKRKQAEIELRENEAMIRDLYNITATSNFSFEKRFDRLLELGCRQFNLDYSFLAEVKGDRYEVLNVVTPDDSVVPGDVFDVRHVYCLEALNSEEPVCIEHASESEWCEHPGYAGFGMESYIGMRVQVANQTHGVLCFCSRQPMQQPFRSVHQQILKLMCQWIGRELERHQDMLALKQSEIQFRESDRRWRSLLDNVQLVVVGLDQQGNVEYANPFFLELTHYTTEEVLGKNWIEHFIPAYQKAETQTSFQEIIEKNFHPHYQNSILTNSGEERIIAWSNTLLHNTEGKAIGTISIGEDVTERYQLDRMKGEFISMVSHELRTPLTSMQAALSLLVDDIIDPSTGDGRDVIQIAATGVDRLVRLVNDILDLERLESGKIRLEKRSCDTADLIAIATEQMQEMANQAGVYLKADPRSFQIHVDGDRLLQVLINFLSNAIKFSSTGSTITLSVGLQAVEITSDNAVLNPSTLLFTVKDQGRGIPADKLDSIFERFHQVDASDSREKGGTGLGLAICRSIVQQHGGQIWAESILDQGSTFYFTLPLKENYHDD